MRDTDFIDVDFCVKIQQLDVMGRDTTFTFYQGALCFRITRDMKMILVSETGSNHLIKMPSSSLHMFVIREACITQLQEHPDTV